MPYRSNDDLPPSIRERLPPHAQDIFRAAFNSAWRQHAGEDGLEQTAHRIAWAAVRRRYRKSVDEWVETRSALP
ncbi:MAG: ChaB family protein [Alphaproteobacteria bacterium]